MEKFCCVDESIYFNWKFFPKAFRKKQIAPNLSSLTYFFSISAFLPFSGQISAFKEKARDAQRGPKNETWDLLIFLIRRRVMFLKYIYYRFLL
jgi:hypothetical protein